MADLFTKEYNTRTRFTRMCIGEALFVLLDQKEYGQIRISDIVKRADVTRVRKMLRNDMNEYKAIASAVSKSEVYKSAFAITVFDGEGLESPTIGGAKAANQLLDISGIKASFVITQYEDKLYISARSIDEVNVQLVMEKLGGGGHMSIAGAQLTNCTIQQAVNTIKLTLDNMLAEGEI